MLTGPIMGSVLYQIGGFQLPFYTVGVLLLALCYAIWQLVDDSTSFTINNVDETEQEREATKEELHRFSFWQILKHFDIWTCAMCHALSLFCLTYKEPILALLLNSWNLGINAIGCIFSLDTITYCMASMGMQMIKDEENGKKYGRL